MEAVADQKTEHGFVDLKGRTILTVKDVCKLYKVSRTTLKVWRDIRAGGDHRYPAYMQLANGTILYTREEFEDAYLKRMKVN